MAPLNCVIRVPAKDSYSTDGETLMGRQSANEGFLTAWFKHTTLPEYWCMARFRSEAEIFARIGHQVRSVRSGAAPTCRWIRQSQIHRATSIGSVYLPGPQVAEIAWVRRRDPSARPDGFSIVGMTHTSCELGIQDGLANMLTAPVYPWDAQICPSQSVQTMVRRLLDEEAAWLREHIGAARIELPQLPVIPLGIDPIRFQPSDSQRAQLRAHWRGHWALSDDDICVLYVGRLDLRTKANLYPTMDALELAARRLRTLQGPRLVLALVGWFASEWDERVLREAAAVACPSVRVLFEDGRPADTRRGVWQAADVFTSLVDNIQETFGLTPLEAMASALPVVVSDYDGYRESVRDAIDGFRIPTIQPPPGCGTDLIELHTDQAIGYRDYVGRASALIGIDIGTAAQAFVKLALEPALRRQMGAAGRDRVQECYDWRKLIPRLQTLFTELAEIRKACAATPRTGSPTGVGPTLQPRRADPFHSFQHYPSSAASADTLIYPGPALPGDSEGQRMALERHLSRPVYQALKAELDVEEAARILQAVLLKPDGVRLAEVFGEQQAARSTVLRCAGWLVKTGLAGVRPNAFPSEADQSSSSR